MLWERGDILGKGRQRLFSIDLLGALKALTESSLVLNVLRPLIVDSEAEVRQNISKWVENIKNDPDLSTESEQRLVRNPSVNS